MNDISEERPEFFEGEYLSAADLEQIVIYLRNQSARHNLGAHVWGIATGLQLVEQETSSGSVDVYLLPGYAIDGYGRPVVVLNPLRLSVNDFNGQPSGPVQVWIRYDQGTTNAVRPGFEVCNAGDAYTRIAESFALVVGNKSTTDAQSGISVSGETVDDARTAPRVFDDNGPIQCDGSVPYQDLPLADEGSQWLIPLGQVGWLAGTPGKFQALSSDNEKLYSRRLRRYLGVVAEDVYAADGVIRLRRRAVEVPEGETVDQEFVDTFCAGGSLSDDLHADDVQMCDDKPAFNELVWVEGRLRVTDDVRLNGGRLELRDANGTDYVPVGNNNKVIAPLFLQRTETNDPDDPNAPSTADLEINIGLAEEGHNRLLVQQVSAPTADDASCGRVQFTAKPLVAVLDNGNVGIGTVEPDQLLEIDAPETGDAGAYIHLHKEGIADLYLGVGADGGVIASLGNDDLRFATGGDGVPPEDEDTRVIIDSDGHVGMGTLEPDDDAVLTLEAPGSCYMIARTLADAAADPDADPPDPDAVSHQILVGADADGAKVSAHSEGDDLILGSNGDDPVMWIKANGRVGIGLDNPAHDLSVQNSSSTSVAVRASNGNHRLLLEANGDGVSIGSNTDDDLLFKHDDDVQMTLTTEGNLGIGTTSPDVRLEVHGNIKLGGSGQYYAPGGMNNWRVIGGRVASTGTPAQGSGFGAAKVGDFYYVTYNDAFTEIPVVTVSGLNGNHDGELPPPGYFQWPVVTFSDENGFHVRFVSTSGSALYEERFSFIVLGPR
jgi:hypothetical protein